MQVVQSRWWDNFPELMFRAIASAQISNAALSSGTADNVNMHLHQQQLPIHLLSLPSRNFPRQSLEDHLIRILKSSRKPHPIISTAQTAITNPSDSASSVVARAPLATCLQQQAKAGRSLQRSSPMMRWWRRRSHLYQTSQSSSPLGHRPQANMCQGHPSSEDLWRRPLRCCSKEA
jgi:hypothetical protein